MIAENPERTVRIAAADLQEYVQKISGARLPIVTRPGDGAVHLFVGRSIYTDQLGIGTEDLKFGAYRIASGNDWMVFIGDDTNFNPQRSAREITMISPAANFRRNGRGGRWDLVRT